MFRLRFQNAILGTWKDGQIGGLKEEVTNCFNVIYAELSASLHQEWWTVPQRQIERLIQDVWRLLKWSSVSVVITPDIDLLIFWHSGPCSNMTFIELFCKSFQTSASPIMYLPTFSPKFTHSISFVRLHIKLEKRMSLFSCYHVRNKMFT